MNNKEREIKKALSNYTVPSYDKDAPMKLIELIHEEASSLNKHRTTNMQFLLSQIGFIRKRTWILQIIILVGLCFIFYKLRSEALLDFRTFSLMSILAPLLVLISINEISRIYNKSMLEIEFSTKNSLKKVLASRMIILGMVDCIALIIMMMFVGASIDISVLRVIMYTLVPFNLVCTGFMVIMKYLKGRELSYACVGYSGGLISIVLLAKFNHLGIYAQDFISVWIFVYVATTMALFIEIKSLWKRLNIFEEVFKEEVI
jgi:hypothetical protein